MLVSEGFVNDVVDVAVFDLVGSHAGERSCDLGEFAAQILALLVGALGGGREGGELGVDLVEEFVQFAEVEGAGAVLVILFEQLV